MKTLRTNLGCILLATILAFASPGHAQDEKQTKAFLVDSFGLMPNGDFKGRADVYMSETRRYPESRALIVLYGPSRQIAARKQLIKDHFSFRRFPMAQLETKIGGNVSEFRTEFWIIPAGAAPPDIKPEAWIAAEFGRVYKRDAVKKISSFFAEMRKLTDHQGYVITYGTPAEIAMREKWITGSISFRTYGSARITLVNGGPGPVRTVMWLVPPGAENPTP